MTISYRETPIDTQSLVNGLQKVEKVTSSKAIANKIYTALYNEIKNPTDGVIGFREIIADASAFKISLSHSEARAVVAYISLYVPPVNKVSCDYAIAKMEQKKVLAIPNGVEMDKWIADMKLRQDNRRAACRYYERMLGSKDLDLCPDSPVKVKPTAPAKALSTWQILSKLVSLERHSPSKVTPAVPEVTTDPFTTFKDAVDSTVIKHTFSQETGTSLYVKAAREILDRSSSISHVRSFESNRTPQGTRKGSELLVYSFSNDEYDNDDATVVVGVMSNDQHEI
jgi:hypothetical protein